MKIGIANDHAGPEMKNELIQYLESKGHTVINYGTDSSESYDYPLAAKMIGEAVRDNVVDLGIAICGTGVGISIACNKIKGVRACVCSDSLSAKLSREHNNANIIAFGARIIGIETAKDIVDTFINTPFSNGERHNRRIALISELEK